MRKNRGVTLIELMVALSITLIMMGAVVTLFANMTTSVTDSRAVIEISERLRAARNRLQLDLAGHTATLMPPLKPEAGEGYFEVVEGTNTDSAGTATNPITGATNTYAANIMGDSDDVLMLTVRSRGEPFVGNVNGTMMESQTAEVIWFAVANGSSIPTNGGQSIQLYTLYRRVLLVLPSANVSGQVIPALYATYDVSVRNDAVSGLVGNTLGDLTKRENRYCHSTAAFPFALSQANLTASIFANLAPNRVGEDVILTDVLAFDVRLFDPLAQLRAMPAPDGSVIGPSEFGYSTAPTTSVGLGTFVDIGNRQGSGYFAGAMQSQSALTLKQPSTYDTWSMHYEQDGINEDMSVSDNFSDEGTNGLDDNTNGIVDEPPSINPTTGTVISQGERETLPPYPFPLRGVQVQIRVYEPSSRQVRQITVVQDFLPE